MNINNINNSEQENFKYLFDLASREGGNTLLSSNTRVPLVDASIDTTAIKGFEDKCYTTTAIANEAGGKLINILPSSNVIVCTITSVNDLKANFNAVNISLSSKGPYATVYYHKLGQTGIFCQCGGEIHSSIESERGGVGLICSSLSANGGRDLSALCLGVGFPNLFKLITNDLCLGWSSIAIDSFYQSKEVSFQNYFR